VTRRRLGLGLCAIGGVVTAVVLAQPLLDYRWSRKPAAQGTTNTPTVPLNVMLDPAGRPYDLALPRRATIERRRLATLVAPSRRVVTLGGEEVPYVKTGDHESLTLAARPRDAYPIDAIWVTHPDLGYDEIVGVVITERESPVARWQELRSVAYGTDAGLGAITTVEWTERPKAYPNELSRLYDEELIERERRWFSADVDGEPGTDTVVFSNGFGDGGFPSVAGYDASGDRVEIVLWTTVAPWRLAFPTGTPPRQVTEREQELAACLAGRRTIDGFRCRRQPR
jgi:hypothetical protein